MMALWTRYVLAIVAVVVIAGALLSLVFRGPGGMLAVWISAAVALVVQLAAFAAGRTIGRGNLVAKMGTGALLRFLALVVYALLTATVLHLSLAPALISIATFFFLTTLVEPLLIRL
jgi:hypothetical protein